MRYQFKNIHKVKAAVFFCLDPRFWEKTLEFIKGELKIDDFDPYVNPGGPKVLVDNDSRDFFLKKLEDVSLKLHHAEEIILIAHRDCGAYGGSKAFGATPEFPNPSAERELQEEDLRRAKAILKEKFPDVRVELWYLEIIGSEIEFQKVL